MVIKTKQNVIVALLSAVLIVLLGSVVLLGWYIRNETLIQVFPQFAPMQYNTALGFLISGAGLVFICLNRGFAAMVCGLAVAFIGIATLLQYIFNLNFGIDEAFMEAYLMVKTSHPGRMAPNTALCFSFSGIILAYLARSKNKKVAQTIADLLGLLIFCLGLLALFGYVFRFERAYGWADLTRMAIHTTVGFLIYSFGLLSYCWKKEKEKIANIPLWIPVLTLTAIVCFELYTPLGVAAGMLYVPLVYISLYFRKLYVPFVFAGVSSILIIFGYFFSTHAVAEENIVLLNRGFSILVVWIMAILVVLQKRTQKKLIESEERQHQTLENAPIGIALVGLKGQWLEINPALCEIVGYSRDELLAIDFQTIMHPDDLDSDLELLQKLRDKEIPFYQMEKRFFHKDGHIVWILLTVGLVRDDVDRPLYYVSQIMDITARKKAEEQANSAKSFQDLIMNTIPDLVFVKNEKLQIVEANEAFKNVYPEESRGKIIGYTTLEGYSTEQVESFTEKDRKAFKEGYNETEETITFPNGAERTLFTKKTRFSNAGENFILGISRDISQIKQTQLELEQANEELEKFAYIASHDLKAPMRGIDNLATWIAEDLEDVMDEDARNKLDLMRQRIKRLEMLLEDILSYSRAGRIVEEPKEVNVKKLIDEIIDSLNLPSTFTLEVHNNLPVFCSVHTPLRQIFLNLITNAFKHHDKKEGHIEIFCEEHSPFFEFAVKDDGPGIPEEFHNRVFEMFQTLQSRDTKESTGLGMSIIKKLVEWQGGKVWIDSKNGERGTIVKFLWPKIHQKGRLNYDQKTGQHSSC